MKGNTAIGDLICEKSWPPNFQCTMKIQRKTLTFMPFIPSDLHWYSLFHGKYHCRSIVKITISSNLKINTFMVKQRWWYLSPYSKQRVLWCKLQKWRTECEPLTYTAEWLSHMSSSNKKTTILVLWQHLIRSKILLTRSLCNTLPL